MIYKLALVTTAAMIAFNKFSVNAAECQCTGCTASEAFCELWATSCEENDGSFVGDCSADATNYACDFSCDGVVDDDGVDAACDMFCSVGTVCEESSVGSCHGNDDDNSCFHTDAMITYKGKTYSFDDLKTGKEPECTVPHTPRSRGVVIETSCNKTVRVTDTHLMATPVGFQLAYSLKAGDKLFGDYENKEVCVVESVNKEKTTQTYFGLNCVHSEVLIDGVRASTFGDFHTLPSWYMYYVGGTVGVDTASMMGDYLAEWYYSI
jgi:hypothetical protein